MRKIIYTLVMSFFLLLFCKSLSINVLAKGDNKEESITTEASDNDDSKSAVVNNASENKNEDDIKDTLLIIDNTNIYDDMEKSYSEGYVPVTEAGILKLVLPLKATGDIKDNTITTGLYLGDGDSTPFIYKNYQKNVSLMENDVNNGAAKVSSYLVTYMLDLKEDRINGNYPIIVRISFLDGKGVKKEQEFTIYAVITDGINPNEEKSTEEIVTEEIKEEPPSFVPKVLVKETKCDKERLLAGEDVSIDIVLENTSKEKAVKNMTVNVSSEEKNISLESASESTYIERIGAGESFTVNYKYHINPATPQGEYILDVTMDYADSEGAAYNSNGKAIIKVFQEEKLSFDKLDIGNEVELGDTVMASFQVMNLGKATVYNVRAIIEADGLTPKGTVFFGNIEAGDSIQESTTIEITGLSGTSSYGETNGMITYYYEDGMGNEYTYTEDFATVIKAPAVYNKPVEKKDDTSQWWVIMAVIVTVISMVLIGKGVDFIKKKRSYDE